MKITALLQNSDGESNGKVRALSSNWELLVPRRYDDMKE